MARRKYQEGGNLAALEKAAGRVTERAGREGLLMEEKIIELRLALRKGEITETEYERRLDDLKEGHQHVSEGETPLSKEGFDKKQRMEHSDFVKEKQFGGLKKIGKKIIKKVKDTGQELQNRKKGVKYIKGVQYVWHRGDWERVKGDDEMGNYSQNEEFKKEGTYPYGKKKQEGGIKEVLGIEARKKKIKRFKRGPQKGKVKKVKISDPEKLYVTEDTTGKDITINKDEGIPEGWMTKYKYNRKTGKLRKRKHTWANVWTKDKWDKEGKLKLKPRQRRKIKKQTGGFLEPPTSYLFD